MLSCPKCQRYPGIGKFCVWCGQALPDEPSLRCRRGHHVYQTDSFCENCGDDLKAHPPTVWSTWKWFFRGMPT